MERMISKILLKKLKELKGCNFHGLDERSFISGYSNGFVNGFYFAKKWIIILGILLTLSLIFNITN